MCVVCECVLVCVFVRCGVVCVMFVGVMWSDVCSVMWCVWWVSVHVMSIHYRV